MFLGPSFEYGWQRRSLLTVSKSIDVNLKSRRKKGGTRMLLLRFVDDMLGYVSSKLTPHSPGAMLKRIVRMWPWIGVFSADREQEWCVFQDFRSQVCSFPSDFITPEVHGGVLSRGTRQNRFIYAFTLFFE